MPIAIEDIQIPDGRRELKTETIRRLADSIEACGLRHPHDR